MNEGQTANFVSGQSRAERQVWSVDSLGGRGVENTVEMTAQYATNRGETAERYRAEAERAARVGEMESEGVLAKTEFFDIKADGVESEMEKREVADAMMEEGLSLDNVVIYTDRKKERPSKPFVQKMDKAFSAGRMEYPDRVMQEVMEARKSALFAMFGRIFPNNGGGA